MKKILLYFSSLIFIGVLLFSACSEDKEIEPVVLLEENEELSGGDMTVFDISLEAFNKPAPNLSIESFNNFQVGNSFFRTVWVPAPASTTARDGVGPLMNAMSCTGCHIRDGRGNPPTTFGAPLVSMLFRLSIPGSNANNSPIGEPNYGGQLQTKAVLGYKPEGSASIQYTEQEGKFTDGTTYSLRVPNYKFTDLNYGDLASNVLFSPRVAPAVFGLGLLESISEEAILAQADESDVDKDGVSGKPNYVWDFTENKRVLGRFGWKANQPNLRQQNAGAFNGDMGLTTPIFSDPDCTDSQLDCQNSPNGGEPEITSEMLDFVTSYVKSLGVPARRNWDDEQVLEGKGLFLEANCQACHTPKYELSSIDDLPEYGTQTIRPFTDLLLHDMGEGLSDKRPDFEATGNEWRTPPLWGIGLVETVNNHTNFLHDGRARNLTEAILWHGGEGENSKQAFLQMNESERKAVLAFLESL